MIIIIITIIITIIFITWAAIPTETSSYTHCMTE